MPVSMDNIPQNIQVPLFYAEVDGSQAGRPGDQYRVLLIGQKLAAGSAAADVPVLVSQPSEAKSLFGIGSMLAAMMTAYRRADSFSDVWCLPLADPGAGAAATGTLTVTGPATEAGTLALYIAGERVEVPVLSGDSAATVAAAIVDAVTAMPDLPVTAAAVGAVVTLTARHKGLLGNDIDLRLNYRGAPGGEKTPAGIQVAFVGMSGGTSAPSLAAGLAALGDDEYDYVAMPFSDTASLDAVKEEWNDVTGRWAWNRQIYGHVFTARAGTLGDLSTFALARNDIHTFGIGFNQEPAPPWAVASVLTAVCAKALSIDPARPVQTLELQGILAPVKPFTLQERNTLLAAGLSMARVNRDGTVRLDRVVSFYKTNAYGYADTAFHDIETLATLQYVIRRLRHAITTKFPRHKLAADGARFGEGQDIVTPNIIRAELIAQYSEMEALGIVENAEAFKTHLIVARDPINENRVNVLYPPDLVNQLRIFAVKAQFRLQYPVAS